MNTSCRRTIQKRKTSCRICNKYFMDVYTNTMIKGSFLFTNKKKKKPSNYDFKHHQNWPGSLVKRPETSLLLFQWKHSNTEKQIFCTFKKRCWFYRKPWGIHRVMRWRTFHTWFRSFLVGLGDQYVLRLTIWMKILKKMKKAKPNPKPKYNLWY